MNNKGITLITVVVMIIIIIIIATVSLLAGNRLIDNANTMATSQKIETVRDHIMMRESEIQMAGSIKPKGDTYEGQLSPVFNNGKIEATGWYLLNPEALSSIGVKNDNSSYLVNYKRALVISMDDNEFLEKYLYYYFITRCKETSDYIGEALQNATKTSNGNMYTINTETGTESYGTGWYKVTKEQAIEKIKTDFNDVELSEFIDDDYLVNYDDDKIVKM